MIVCSNIAGPSTRGAEKKRKSEKRRRSTFAVSQQYAWVPCYLKEQINDPAFVAICELGESCIVGLTPDNVCMRVVSYHNDIMAYFRQNGVQLLHRMILSKPLCEIILKQHFRLECFVLRACRSIDCGLDIIDSLHNVSDCYPKSSKHRNSPSAIRKMKDLKDEQAEIERQKNTMSNFEWANQHSLEECVDGK